MPYYDENGNFHNDNFGKKRGNHPMSKTEPSSHKERKRATTGTAEAKLLDDLDEAIVRRNKADGELGNLVGKLRLVEADVANKKTEVANLEARASRLRKAFETLHTATLDEAFDDAAEALAEGERKILEFAADQPRAAVEEVRERHAEWAAAQPAEGEPGEPTLA